MIVQQINRRHGVTPQVTETATEGKWLAFRKWPPEGHAITDRPSARITRQQYYHKDRNISRVSSVQEGINELLQWYNMLPIPRQGGGGDW